MKNNKSLIIMISVSVLVLGLLIFSVIKFSSKDVPVFYGNGYVSVSDAEKSEKVYFSEGSAYKKAYNNNISFKTKENEKTEVSKYSFVLYDDKSIGFLTDGVIMDLNKVNDAFIPYYNIKNNYVIQSIAGKYRINASDKDIILNNFIGRIDENKYIVAGNDLRLKLSSSDDYISGYYFELIFSDGDIVKIDNDKMSTETISSESYILIGDNIKIDLSKRAIFYENEVKVNLSEIIIDNDTNIDILYEDINGGGSGSGDGNSSGEGEDNTTASEDPWANPEYKVETVTDYKSVPYVELVNSSSNAHKISLGFTVSDKSNLITSDVVVKLYNMQTGETREQRYSNYSGILDYVADNLTSNSSYMVTIQTSYVRNNNIFRDYNMFQRTFKTTDIGVELAKDYATSTELGYKITLDNTATFTSGALNLYDKDGVLVDSYNFNNTGGVINAIFSNLDANSSYTAKIENITYGNVKYATGFAASVSTQTLKFNPFKDDLLVMSPVAKVNKIDYNIKFDLGEINDKNGAIKEVVYNVYEKDTDKIVKTIKRSDINEVTVNIDDDIKAHTTYYYKTVITLNDGEKNIEYETLASNLFNLDNKISPTMRFEEKELTANTIEGTFVISDPDDAIDTEKDIYVTYNSTLGDTDTMYLKFKACGDEENSTAKCADVRLIDLKSSDIYTLNLYAYVDLKAEDIAPDYTLVGAIKVNTQRAETIITDMSSNELSETESLDKVFEINIGLALPDGADETLKDNLNGFDIMLYEGFDTTGMYLSSIHVDNATAKEYFEGQKTLNIKDFNYSLEALQKLHIADGSISKAYSIRLRNGQAKDDYVEFKPDYLNFEVNETLLNLSNNDATIDVSPILNSNLSDYYDNTLNNDTIIGLKITTAFGNKKYAVSINYTVYDVTDPNNITSKEYHDMVFLADGSANPVKEIYFSEDNAFYKRGRTYAVSYTVSLDLNGDKNADLEYPFNINNISIPSPVRSIDVDVPKQKPSMVLFPWTSEENNITYKFQTIDVDNALPADYKLNYEVGGESYEAVFANCRNSNNITGYTTKYSCARLDNLNNNDIYKIYLNAYFLEKAGTMPSRVDINDFTFESILTSLDSIRYDAILNDDGLTKYTNVIALRVTEDYDNLPEEEKLNAEELKKRISYYSLDLVLGDKIFRINNVNNNTRTSSPISSNIIEYIENNKTVKSWTNQNKTDSGLSKLAYVSACEDGLGECIYIDYSKLYNSVTFKEEFAPFKNASINILVTATYDTGKIGYLATGQKNYTFQVKSNEIISKARVYNNLYLQTFGSRVTQMAFNDNAGATSYAYLTSSRQGFVDDGASDNNDFTGKMSFVNTSFTNLSTSSTNLGSNYFDADYVVTKRGVEFNYTIDNVSLPIVAKELGTSTLNGNGLFTFDKVVPAINVQARMLTVNGAKMSFAITGLSEEDALLEDDKIYVYFEIYDEESNLIKTLKVNKDELISQIGTGSAGTYTVRTDDKYKLDVFSVMVNGEAITDYNYDYKTGIITSEKINENDEITINYRLVIDNLNSNTNYYIKAYMKMGRSATKTYLVDSTSSTYADFEYAIKTKNASEVKITNASFDFTSDPDYMTRNLIIDYTIDDIIGLDNLTYNICTADGSLCVDASKYIKMQDECYNAFDKTCFSKVNNTYNAQIYNDISITNDLDFIFGTDYNLVINADVIEFDEKKTYEIYNNSLHVRDLVSPTVTVNKNSKHKGDNYYITFDVSFKDDDRVVSIPRGGDKNGYFVAYLAMGPDRVKVQNPVDKDGNSLPTEQIIALTMDGADKVASLNYGSLQKDSQYYLIVEYKTYRNNATLDPKEESYGIPTLVYTLDDNNISVGMIDYSATGTTSILKFGYASNITQDFIKNEMGELVPNPDQEAYVAGISYTIRRQSGDDLFQIADTVIFKDGDIRYVTEDNSSSEIGDSYYELVLNNTIYPVETFYIMTFKFYLGGNITAHLTTEEACKADGISNYWDNEKNTCYKLGSVTYTDNTLYGGAK